ncbi:MAG: chemotaxis response regulator protein-glutamate methylesterase [Deltaproteobacteria bacterium]|nr:chemotaxis response regulator protein-glutamate methylesterase [Deltaproteobacteria bacterium]MBW2020199.1 chemotaxis response regulator protein-glutamate methylesterase [Deltaproteobacteria bacterium]MBW2075099.1 chemotaxis response regulator protein-glutamate methylesterase [Deltaproteobacteria bacterium]RLB81516.1 MAG: chemotaxis response regulator protein-glutamate methylesterase [Deltaproteobacteria bacterium]
MTNGNPIKVLVVDDTVFYRKIVSDILAELPDVEVVGTANNGKIAMSRIAFLEPDLLILDIEMPEMSGLEVLASIQERSLDVGAIVLSSLTPEGGEITMRALDLGAFDFVPKPDTGSMEENRKVIRDTLVSMLKAFVRRKEVRRILKGESDLAGTESVDRQRGVVSPGVVQRMGAITSRRTVKSEIVGIGISTGGPNALSQIMPQFPADLGVPILIVQHMPPMFTQALAKSLDSKCSMEVKEAIDGQPLLPNVALIAPGGKQMKLVTGEDGINRIVRITDDPPENSCKPSIDYLFRSIARHYVGRATGVIMTGMGSDGVLGLKLMKRNGSTIIAQDESTCVVYGMSKEAIDAGVVDVIAPLDQISAEIMKTVRIYH